MIRLKQFLIAFIVYACPAVAFACGNEYGDLDMILKHSGHKAGVLPYWINGRDMTDDIRKKLDSLSKQIDARAALLTTRPRSPLG